VFHIIQFFLSLNYQLIPLILNKAGFDSKVSFFFFDYLVDRKIQYIWNSFIFPFSNADVYIGQGSVLYLILSTLFILPIFYIFEKRKKSLKIPISFLLFVHNRLLISQEKSFDKKNSHFFCSYSIISSLLEQFGFIIKHIKTKVFYFSRLHSLFNFPSLNLSYIGDSILYPKDSWKYLGIIFDRKLFFYQHIKFYVNKALFIVKCMKMLENSTYELLSY